LKDVTRFDNKASIVLEGRNGMSTFDVNCGCEGTLGLQSVDEKVNVIKTGKKVGVRAS
jgi:hypothetical protein